MTQVILGKSEGTDSALQRFKQQVSQHGLLADVKRLRHFKTSIEKRLCKEKARRNQRRFRRVS